MRLFFLPFFAFLFLSSVLFVSAHTGDTAEIKLSPSLETVSSGGSLTVSVLIDTAQNPVNAVQANLSYPTNKLTFVRINTSNSQFGVQAQNADENGVVKIARGSLQPLTGETLKLAEVVFTANSTVAASEIQLSTGSQVVRSTDHENILTTSTGSAPQGTDGMPSKNPYGDPGVRPTGDSGLVGGIAAFTRGIFQGIASFFTNLF